jgi:hypothetical protein
MMNNGVIHDNRANTDGGGLIVNGNGIFTMNGGVIKNNRATLGGGVRLWSAATFIMAGGTVYGSDAEPGLANTASWDGASLSIGQSTGHAYWGDGTTSIGTSVNDTLYGGNPTGTVGTSPGTGAAGLYVGTASSPTDISGMAGSGTLAKALAWIAANAADNTEYTVKLDADESMESYHLKPVTVNNKSDVTITLLGIDSERTIQLTGTGLLFRIWEVTLVLDANITLRGISNNNDTLVWAENAGHLILKDGSTITGNNKATTGAGSFGGGAGCSADGVITMYGGTISGNAADRGGGVAVYDYGKFYMHGGVISGNTARGFISHFGGGVYIFPAAGEFKKQPLEASTTSGIIYGGSETDPAKRNTTDAVSDFGTSVSETLDETDHRDF